jgi:hypothetical protein
MNGLGEHIGCLNRSEPGFLRIFFRLTKGDPSAVAQDHPI